MRLLLSALSLLESIMATTAYYPGYYPGCCDNRNGLQSPGACGLKNCLRPISGESFNCNCILSKFTVTFGSVTAVDATTGALTGFIDNSVHLQMFDNGELCNPCQSALYLRVNTAGSTELFNPALIHVMVFTPKADTSLEDIVCLYSIYALRQDPVAMAITPSVNETNYSLNVQFPANYDFNGQTIIAEYNTWATSLQVTPDTTTTPPSNYTVSITAEVLSAAGTGEIAALPTPATMTFRNYAGRSSETSEILKRLDNDISLKCENVYPKEEQLCKLRCYVKHCEIIRKLSYRCASPRRGGRKISNKCMVYRYFAFVSNCLAVIPKICYKDDYACAQKVVDACSKCEDPYNVFCAIIARLYVGISIEAQSCLESFYTLFETIVGLNVYCLPHKDFEKLYGLGAKDAEAVRGACPDECAVEEDKELGTVEGGETADGEDGKDGENRGSGKSGFARYGWTIAIIVVVVAVISITAVALY